MPVVAAILLAVLLTAGAVVAVVQRRPFLWRRAAVLSVAVYAWGAWAGTWPWPQSLPLLDHLTHWLGG